MPQSFVLASVESNAPSPACDCLAHRFDNTADGPDRVRCYGSDLAETEWQVIRPLLPVPAWLQGRGGRPEGYCHRVTLDAVRYVADDAACRWDVSIFFAQSAVAGAGRTLEVQGPDGLVQREHAVGVPGFGALEPQSAQILGLVRLSRPWSVTAGF